MPLDDIDRADGTSTPMRRRRTYSVVSTFPPTPCGVATFSAALCGGLVARWRRRHRRSGRRRERRTRNPRVVASLSDAHARRPPRTPSTRWHGPTSWSSSTSTASTQGKDGDSVIGLLDAVEAPTIVVAHTVLRSPTPHQRAVLEEVAARRRRRRRDDRGRARRLLVGGFDVDPTKVVVIPHGAAVAPPHRRAVRRVELARSSPGACSVPARGSSGRSTPWPCSTISGLERRIGSPATRTRRWRP